MNPSYDNNFGSLNPGGPEQSGNFPASPVSQSAQQTASQPTPQSPQQYPQQSYQQPISSGQGDIILTPTKTKKSKKWLVAVLAITIITVLIAALLFIFFIRPLENDKIINLKQQLLNYVVNGDASNDDTGEDYSDMRNYYFRDMFYNENESESIEYYNKILEILNQLKSGKGSNLDAASIELENTIKMLQSYKEFEKYDLENLVSSYFDNSQIIEEIASNLRAFDRQANYYTDMYVDYMEDYLDNSKLMLEKFISAGCSGNSLSLLSSCNSNDDKNLEARYYMYAADEAKFNAQQVAKSAVTYFIEETYVLSKNNGDNV